MNELPIKSISSVSGSETGGYTKTIPDKPEALREPVISDSEKSHKVDEAETNRETNLANISVHFQVDEQSNEMTVFVIDRASRRVLRSIPASELSKLQVGELLKLTA